MADPKYADLPGIAYDQPDLYETSDLPEADQNSEYFEEESDSIERLHLSASEAFSKFKGKTLNSTGVDFSDRLSRHRRTGYDARSGDWELVAEGEKETPQQKYHRLRCEMEELIEEVSQLKDAAKDSSSEETTVVLSSQVQEAQKLLTEINLEKMLGSELITNLADPQGCQLKKLLSQIEVLKQAGAEKPSQSKSPSKEGSSGMISYQLQYWPEQSRLAQTSRVAELEQRLHRLEAVLGASSERMSRLSLEAQHQSLVEATQNLAAKASLLDPAQLDHIEGRLAALGTKMDAVAEKNAVTRENAERDKKVEELYELMKKTEDLTQVLPQTFQRMVALESLHQQAANFSKSLTQLEALQQQMTASIHNNETLLKTVQSDLASNLEAITKNMKTLDSRITALKKK